MKSKTFDAVAWSNGSSAYGLKVSAEDRDRHIKRIWKTIEIRFPDTVETAVVNVDKSSLWNDTCRELISAKIGAWFRRNGKLPWTKGHPPMIVIKSIGEGCFSVSFA